MIINKCNAKDIFANEAYPNIYVISNGITRQLSTKNEAKVVGILPNVTAEQLGSQDFKNIYGTKYAYYAGAMARGISSVEMVIALGKCGFMGSYGSGGQTIEEIEKAVDKIKRELPNGPYLINVLANPNNPKEEFKLVQTLIQNNVTAIEASAFVQPTTALIYYRLKGAKLDDSGRVIIKNRIIAKVSREEVSSHFLSVPDEGLVAQLFEQGFLSDEEVVCGKRIPLADDITVEADSGGHTDNRPLVSMFPAMVELRNMLQKEMVYKTRMGAGGGIASGSSALCAFSLGADYIVTGSINQSCIEAGTSEYVKQILAKAKMADTTMCPSADMFEMGGKVQVLKTGTMFAQRAQKLFQCYLTYPSFDTIPLKDRNLIENRILCNTFEAIWEQTKDYFQKRDPDQIARAEVNPKYKMALVFRWYLGSASKWAQEDVIERRMDMQIWCGQSMGAFNMEVKGTKMEHPLHRKVAEVAYFIMKSAAIAQNKQIAQFAGVSKEDLSEE